MLSEGLLSFGARLTVRSRAEQAEPLRGRNEPLRGRASAPSCGSAWLGRLRGLARLSPKARSRLRGRPAERAAPACAARGRPLPGRGRHRRRGRSAISPLRTAALWRLRGFKVIFSWITVAKISSYDNYPPKPRAAALQSSAGAGAVR